MMKSNHHQESQDLRRGPSCLPTGGGGGGSANLLHGCSDEPLAAPAC